jgi:hypothetical protein
MAHNSVETAPTAAQSPSLASWPAIGGTVTLEPTGPDTAGLWFTSHTDNREPYGTVTYDPERERYIADWNDFGRMMYGRSQIESMDREIAGAMARRQA